MVMNIHIPSSKNLYNSERNLIGYSFGNKTYSGSDGDSKTTR